MEGVAIEKIVKKLELKKLTEGMDLTGHRIVLSDVNRPALQLSGILNISRRRECRSSEM